VSNAIAITGLGCTTPVGLSVRATCAALRAGIARMTEFEGWEEDGPGPPGDLVAGRVPLEQLLRKTDEQWPGHERWNLPPPRPHLLIKGDEARLAEIGVPAAEEAWADAGGPDGRVGLYLGLDDEDEGSGLSAALARALDVEFYLQRADRFGRAAGLVALHHAAEHLRQGRVDVALVGAVDSCLRRASLARLQESGALRSADNPQGVIPGEAAVFLVLQSDSRQPRAHILGSAMAEEPTAGTDQANRGEGLSQALRRAREAAGQFVSRPLVVCDLNGDRYRTLEWGLVNVRVLGDVRSIPGGPASSDVWHPADCIGDTGAASGGVSVMTAVTAMRKGYAGADRALVWGASDGPLRAAAILSVES